MSKHDNDLALIREAVREAGALALRHWKTDFEIWDKEPGHPVTQIDLDVNDLLKARLMGARPDYGWLSEETADSADRFDRRFLFVVDPIDGTKAFMTGDPNFVVSVALLEYGEPVVGVVFSPAFGELYEATRDGGSYLNGKPITVSQAGAIDDCRMIGEPRMFEHPDWPEPWPRMTLARPKPNSTAYRMTLVADGRWDGTLVLWRKGDWDVAAAALIVEEAGGRVTDHRGRAYRFNRPVAAQTSLVAGSPALHSLLIDRCKHVVLPEPNPDT